ncbi:hypothetical protein [uncultured Mailhella sp.]|uniref:hypothetical protein n=1 Tax=uncultured Mailhella sp. TaxID=1981031 RepID=UPI0025EFF61E|nr:hypothetical protein [uncultured Mailhella sp.]
MSMTCKCQPVSDYRTKTTFALPASDYERLELLSQYLSMSIRSILDEIAHHADAHFNLNKAHIILLPNDPCSRKSYGISMKSKQIFENLAERFDCTRNQVLHAALKDYCRHMEKTLQELTALRLESARKLMEMRDKMLEIYEQPEYEAARKNLLPLEDPEFAKCNEFLGSIEKLYEFDLVLQEFIKKQHAALNLSSSR